MRNLSTSSADLPPAGASASRNDWNVLGRLLPYLWQYKWRVLIALLCMILAKVANVGVPVLLKHLVDALDVKAGQPQALLVVPVALLLGYGLLRFIAEYFREPDDFLGLLSLNLSMGQWLSLPMVLLGIYLWNRGRNQPLLQAR